MIKHLTPAVLAFCAVIYVAPSASATHCGAGVSEEVCVTGQGQGFDLEGREVEDASGPAEQSRPRGVKVNLPPTYKDLNYVPTCTGNSAFDAGVLCNAAVQTCPPGEIRFWVFEVVISRATGQPVPGEPATFRETVCRGPNAPEINPLVAIPALVQSEFKSVVVVSGNAKVSPAPETLVNVPTRFETDAPASYVIPLTLLGRQVFITAKAERYIWQVGEGKRRVSTRPKGYLEYSYKRAGAREVYVDIEWSGTFRIGDGAEQPITGTVITEGEPVDVQVQQARSELVRD